MKKKNEELEEKCTCGCNEECTCGDNCTCGDDCGCDCCDEEYFPPIEEKLVLVGKSSDNNTKEIIDELNKKDLIYSFIDLDEKVDEMFEEISKEVEVPSLLLVQTVVSGLASGVQEIKEALK